LAELIPTYLRIQVFNILLESYASEQGARMMAMEEASDRAEKTLKELGIQFNRIRRDLVTLDLLGILSAAKVIEKEAASSVGF
jgi:F-type H+-transporting ATPase subunit gamma